MAFTQTQIDMLKTALASGIRTVSYPTGSVTYGSTREMMEVLKLMESEVNGVSGSRTTFVETCRE